MEQRTIKRALISVYDKNGIEQISKRLIELNVEIVSTGGTFDYLKSLGIGYHFYMGRYYKTNPETGLSALEEILDETTEKFSEISGFAF